MKSSANNTRCIGIGLPPIVTPNDTPMNIPRFPAILLLGPTGSGKTPLGQWIESHGLHGLKCVHFDFGENLRNVVAANSPTETFTTADLAFLRRVLDSGALLEDEHFVLAERILRDFLARRCTNAATCVVLNGLPRHAGQAQAIDAIVDVQKVVCLECSSEVVVERLIGNTGGDRDGRTDDDFDRVRKKLELYRQRTVPLVDYYRTRGMPIQTISVTAATTAAQAFGNLGV